jgi:small subunit ribosomal protein S2
MSQPIVSVKDLLDSGIHFGTAASLWHPRIKPFLYGKRGNIHVIDVRATVRGLIQAHYYMAKLAKANKTVLFVGTKRQAKEIVRETAQSVGMPHVSERWIGGTLTNFETVRASIRRLDGIEAEMSKPEYIRESKKIQSRHSRERRRILRNLEGVRTLSRLPDALVVIDPTYEEEAVKEAKKLGIPVVGLVDTDTDPELVNLCIPGNDDGIRSIQVVAKVLADGLRKGRSEMNQPSEAPATAAAAK